MWTGECETLSELSACLSEGYFGKLGKQIIRTACTEWVGAFKSLLADKIFLNAYWNRKTSFLFLHSYTVVNSVRAQAWK